MGFYDEMADMAADLLAPEDEGGLGQGEVLLRRVVTTPGANPWDEPTEQITDTKLSATVKRVDQRYENGALIIATGDIVTFAPVEPEPANANVLVIDGRERAITNLKRIPGAGVCVAWQCFCAA
ncbi:hypothetical protein NGM99_13770 [Mesorhizobium sp. RP14(2022)]|uniref:Uncharacterized protein n=1 Tax=Mesorhizobium liriopis TaxID=2953882 RepID=A0ABT1C7N3_9HYPH|nr:hypothetical protein [Mesorhizobium liriopis]MCO6050847.1 hypothetical protein [Mesorhizobium liriopis]